MRDLPLCFIRIVVDLYLLFRTIWIIRVIRPKIRLSHRLFTLFMTTFMTTVLTLVTAAGLFIFFCHIAVFNSLRIKLPE